MQIIPKIEPIKMKHKDKAGLEGDFLTSGSPKSRKPPRKLFSSSHGRRSPAPKSSRTPKAGKRSCTTIVSYRESKALHMKNFEYIQREGKGEDGETPELYGSLSKEEYEEQMSDMSWRIILSPDTNDINLEHMTKAFIEKLEAHTGYKFKWIAANHYDTAKHHTHILIDGNDKHGRQVRFQPPTLVKNLMREYARDICTTLAGPLTESEEIKRLADSTEKNYFTQLDKTIKEYLSGTTVKKSYMTNKNERYMTKRLDYLVKLGLATYSKKDMSYTIAENWEEELRKLGRYNTYLDGFNWAGCSKENYYLHDPKKDGDIQGEVIRRYTMQKDSNNFAILLRQNDGKVAYVPLNFFPTNCLPGDKISITNKDKKTLINNNTRGNNQA